MDSALVERIKQRPLGRNSARSIPKGFRHCHWFLLGAISILTFSSWNASASK
jgi:hypothetical protein